MRSSTVVWQHALRLTLFTRPHCGLCDEAKYILTKIRPKRPFDYAEIDVMSPGQQKWKDVYELDTPVVHINHLEKDKGFETTAQAKKLMHRFTEAQLQAAMDAVEKGA